MRWNCNSLVTQLWSSSFFDFPFTFKLQIYIFTHFTVNTLINSRLNFAFIDIYFEGRFNFQCSLCSCMWACLNDQPTNNGFIKQMEGTMTAPPTHTHALLYWLTAFWIRLLSVTDISIWCAAFQRTTKYRFFFYCLHEKLSKWGFITSGKLVIRIHYKRALKPLVHPTK